MVGIASRCRSASRGPAAGATVLLLTAVLQGACTSASVREPVAESETTAATAPLPSNAPTLTQLWPISTSLYRTTSADIYLGNLDSRIVALEAQIAAGQHQRSVSLASALYHRYRVVGRLDDAERALALLRSRAMQDGLEAEGMLLYATALSGLHQFSEARDWLERARKAGISEGKAEGLAADIAVAIGDYDALRTEMGDSARPVDEFYALAHRADLRLLQGDLGGASRLYLGAQTLYFDVNPVPLAWLHTQMGIALLRSGQASEARRFFSAAVERLPGYYLAEEHLAECETLAGEFDAARSRYRRVIAQTGNPEFIAALADLERRAGNDEEAARLSREAEAQYTALMQRYPDAFGQHAAEFLIQIGQAERADALAQANLKLRHDVGSWILMAQTAQAVGDMGRACTARTQAVQTALRPPELAELDALAPRCR